MHVTAALAAALVAAVSAVVTPTGNATRPWSRPAAERHARAETLPWRRPRPTGDGAAASLPPWRQRMVGKLTATPSAEEAADGPEGPQAAEAVAANTYGDHMPAVELNASNLDGRLLAVDGGNRVVEMLKGVFHGAPPRADGDAGRRHDAETTPPPRTLLDVMHRHDAQTSLSGHKGLLDSVAVMQPDAFVVLPGRMDDGEGKALDTDHPATLKDDEGLAFVLPDDFVTEYESAAQAAKWVPAATWRGSGLRPTHDEATARWPWDRITKRRRAPAPDTAEGPSAVIKSKTVDEHTLVTKSYILQAAALPLRQTPVSKDEMLVSPSHAPVPPFRAHSDAFLPGTVPQPVTAHHAPRSGISTAAAITDEIIPPSAATRPLATHYVAPTEFEMSWDAAARAKVFTSSKSTYHESPVTKTTVYFSSEPKPTVIESSTSDRLLTESTISSHKTPRVSRNTATEKMTSRPEENVASDSLVRGVKVTSVVSTSSVSVVVTERHADTSEDVAEVKRHVTPRPPPSTTPQAEPSRGDESGRRQPPTPASSAPEAVPESSQLEWGSAAAAKFVNETGNKTAGSGKTPPSMRATSSDANRTSQYAPSTSRDQSTRAGRNEVSSSSANEFSRKRSTAGQSYETSTRIGTATSVGSTSGQIYENFTRSGSTVSLGSTSGQVYENSTRGVAGLGSAVAATPTSKAAGDPSSEPATRKKPEEAASASSVLQQMTSPLQKSTVQEHKGNAVSSTTEKADAKRVPAWLESSGAANDGSTLRLTTTTAATSTWANAKTKMKPAWESTAAYLLARSSTVAEAVVEPPSKRRTKGVTVSIFGPSEALEPSRKAIVITFPKLKTVQTFANSADKNETKNSSSSQVEERPSKVEAELSDKTASSSASREWPTERLTLMQDLGFTKKNVTPALSPTNTSTDIPVRVLNVSTPETTYLVKGKETTLSKLALVTSSAANAMKRISSNRARVLLTVQLTRLNETLLLLNETISLDPESRDDQSKGMLVSPSQNKSGTILEDPKLANISKLIREYIVTMSVQDKSKAPETTPVSPTERASTPDFVKRTETAVLLDEFTKPPIISTKAFDIASSATANGNTMTIGSYIPEAEQTISGKISNATMITAQTDLGIESHTENNHDIDSNNKQAMLGEVFANGSSVILYVDSIDCSPEIADKISALEDPAFDDNTEKIVIELNCKPQAPEFEQSPEDDWLEGQNFVPIEVPPIQALDTSKSEPFLNGREKASYVGDAIFPPDMYNDLFVTTVTAHPRFKRSSANAKLPKSYPTAGSQTDATSRLSRSPQLSTKMLPEVKPVAIVTAPAMEATVYEGAIEIENRFNKYEYADRLTATSKVDVKMTTKGKQVEPKSSNKVSSFSKTYFSTKKTSQKTTTSWTSKEGPRKPTRSSIFSLGKGTTTLEFLRMQAGAFDENRALFNDHPFAPQQYPILGIEPREERFDGQFDLLPKDSTEYNRPTKAPTWSNLKLVGITTASVIKSTETLHADPVKELRSLASSPSPVTLLRLSNPDFISNNLRNVPTTVGGVQNHLNSNSFEGAWVPSTQSAREQYGQSSIFHEDETKLIPSQQGSLPTHPHYFYPREKSVTVDSSSRPSYVLGDLPFSSASPLTSIQSTTTEQLAEARKYRKKNNDAKSKELSFSLEISAGIQGGVYTDVKKEPLIMTSLTTVAKKENSFQQLNDPLLPQTSSTWKLPVKASSFDLGTTVAKPQQFFPEMKPSLMLQSWSPSRLTSVRPKSTIEQKMTSSTLDQRNASTKPSMSGVTPTYLPPVLETLLNYIKEYLAAIAKHQPTILDLERYDVLHKILEDESRGSYAGNLTSKVGAGNKHDKNLDDCDGLCKQKKRTVCAQVGSITRTFDSLCEVKIEGCIVGENTKIRHTGPCTRFRKKMTKVIIEEQEVMSDDDQIEDVTLRTTTTTSRS